ncbi:MAG: anti-sigma factor domain-containing protein [Phycisphaerales bacterium JB037]
MNSHRPGVGDALHPDARRRLLELLADEQFGALSPEDRTELDTLLEQSGGRDAVALTIADLLPALDNESEGDLPAALRQRLIAIGAGIAKNPNPRPIAAATPAAPRWWVAGIAATIALASVAVLIITAVNGRRDLADSRERIATLEQQVEQNAQTIRTARASAERLRTELAESGRSLTETERQLADARQSNIDLAQQLATATSDLELAQLAIARYEQPADPAELAANRRKLLEVPGTVRLAWSPFDLPDAPAEQRDVTGDVIWNDDLQTGYLRFVGLDVNDPNIEQYQVWVIDERGMEQKVSGGVFNASAEGEVIVPIEPGIDVGRVALFAITVEEPGGTWVPDLQRRVVVAPREQG